MFAELVKGLFFFVMLAVNMTKGQPEKFLFCNRENRCWHTKLRTGSGGRFLDAASTLGNNPVIVV